MSGGYGVQKTGMAEEAGKLDRAGDDVKKIRRAVEDQMCYTPDVLGGSDSGPAYDSFASAWQAEAKTLEAALHELADKIRVSEQNYQGADDDAMIGLNAATGDGGLTTMPAPAGDGLTKMPAPAGPADKQTLGLDDFNTQPAPAGPVGGRILGRDDVTTQPAPATGPVPGISAQPAPAGPEGERILGRDDVTTQPVPAQGPTLADFD